MATSFINISVPNKAFLKALPAISRSDKNTLVRFLKNLPKAQLQDFYQFTQAQGIAARVFSLIREKAEFLPAAIYENFKKVYQTTLFRNIQIMEVWQEVSQRLTESGIAWIPFKGVFSLNFLVKDPGERHLTDIDLLVPARAFSLAANLLTQMGFDNASPLQKDRPFSAQLYPIAEFIRNRVLVDLHCHFDWPLKCGIDVAGIWQRSRPLHLNSLGRIMEETDYFLCLCAHPIKDGLDIPLRTYLDICDYYQAYHHVISWKQFLRRAYQWRVKTGVFYILSQLQAFDLLESPAFVIEALRPASGTRYLIDSLKILEFNKGEGLPHKRLLQLLGLLLLNDFSLKSAQFLLFYTGVRLLDRLNNYLTGRSIASV
jgi:hypothetical protein